jgi:hypothetical protein
MKYYRLCEGLNSKGKLIPIHEDIYKHIPREKLNKDWYKSVYYYNEEQYNKFYEKITEINNNNQAYETIRGCSGINDVITNKLVFDFDIDKHKKKTISDCKSDAIELCTRLITKGISKYAIQITFSGNKGFGVIVETEELFTPQEHKNIAKQLAEDLETWDTKVYNASRVLRVEWTKHQNSNLYKIPLSLDDLSEMNSSEIKEFAGEFNPKEHDIEIPETWAKIKEIPTNILKLKELPKTTQNSVNLSLNEKFDLDLTCRPKWLSNWKYALLNGYFPEGCRSYALMILCSTFKSQGFPKNVAYGMLKEAATLQSQRFGSERFDKQDIWKTVIKTVYGNNWNGGTYSEDNFPDELKDYLNELNIPRESKVQEDFDKDVDMSIMESLTDFYDYESKIDENTMLFGIPQLDSKLDCQVGHLIAILAPPGMGKTSFLLTLLQNVSDQGIDAWFGCYDMYKNILTRKLIIRETGYSKDKIRDIYINNDVKKIDKIQKILIEKYNNVHFCYKSGQNINEIKKSIQLKEEKLGRPIKFVAIDYLELIQSNYSDMTAASAETIQGLREIANSGKCVVVLLQPNKMSSKPNEPLLSANCAKGSSSINQAVTSMITAHRPGYNPIEPERDKFFCINCVKNREGPLFSLDFHWNGLQGKIRELDDSEKAELKSLRKELADVKEDELL